MHDFSEEKKFIHAIATPLSVAEGRVKRALRKFEAGNLEDVASQIHEALETFKVIGTMIRERREAINALEREDPSSKRS